MFCGFAYPLVALGIADEVSDPRGEVLGFGGIGQRFHYLADTDCSPATDDTTTHQKTSQQKTRRS